MIDPKPLRKTAIRLAVLRYIRDNPRKISRVQPLGSNAAWVGSPELDRPGWRRAMNDFRDSGFLSLLRSATYRERWGTGDVLLALEGERTLARWETSEESK